MANVKLGKTTKSIVEFFVYDNEDKQCGSIYFFEQNGNGVVPDYRTIGNIPDDIKDNICKLQWVAEAKFRKNYK